MFPGEHFLESRDLVDVALSALDVGLSVDLTSSRSSRSLLTLTSLSLRLLALFSHKLVREMTLRQATDGFTYVVDWHNGAKVSRVGH